MTTTTNPAPTTDGPIRPRQFVLHFEDGALLLTDACGVGAHLAHAAAGYDDEPPTIFTFVDGQPVPVGIRSRQSPFDEDDYADVRVELTDSVNGGVLDVTGYRIDGRA